MAGPQPPTSLYPVTSLLYYIHAPTVGLFFLTTTAFGFCTLQKPIPTTPKRRRGVLAFATLVLAVYVAESLYYLSRVVAEPDYAAPKPAAIRCLGSILVWTHLVYWIWQSTSIRWHPYAGAFVLEFSIDTATCLLSAESVPKTDRSGNSLLFFGWIRVLASLILSVDAFAIVVTKSPKISSAEEKQPLLGQQTTGMAARNDSPGNGAINQVVLEDTEEAPRDPDEKTKKKQATRLQNESGWVGYLKPFAALLPCLYPWEDQMVMGCLLIRLIGMLLERALNLLTPRQLGIITNKLNQHPNVIPWKDIGLWTLFRWMGSDAGFDFIDGMAKTVISDSTTQRITLLACKHIYSLSMDFHTSKDSGEVIKAVEQASSLNKLVDMILFRICPTLIDVVVALYYVTQMFDAYMSFIVLFMGFAYVRIGWYSTTLLEAKRRDFIKKLQTQSSSLDEVVRNWHTVTYFNRANFEYSRHKSAIADTLTARRSVQLMHQLGCAVQDILTTLGFAGCCIFAISQIAAGGKTVGDFVTLIVYWQRIMSPLFALSSSQNSISHLLIDAERLVQLLNTKPSVTDRKDARELVVHAGKVEFEAVEFAYDERKPTIRGLDLQVGGGQTIAFVGGTGGGKTTVLNLLFRLYDVDSGSIMIDGQDLRSVTQSSLHDALGLVPQDPALFNWTILENIRYARLNATDAEITDACRVAVIHDEIVALPEGYNTKVGERGVKLSGGQLQRIAIARALLKNPKIILLDEATSAMDSCTEVRIQKALRKLSEGRTTFVIAHRLSTIMDADQIVVLEEGKITQRGTHSELLEASGKYLELWTRQTASYQKGGVLQQGDAS
jgi:ABC-type transport system involved in Fe-S cluster assembly fused permease/ATPase subunit